jgi:hypothetical protein
MVMVMEVSDRWPPLPLEAWKDTCETLQLWTQVVGKVKLKLAPFLNEWWQVGFHLTARGMTTGLIPSGNRVFEVRFDFITHNLVVEASDGQVKTTPLRPRSVADFYEEFMAALNSLNIDVAINPMPVEMPVSTPFDKDNAHSSYDAGAVHRWWQVLIQTAKVLEQYRSPFVGKSSPVLFYWGSFDLNETRFSGRPAPPLAGAPRFFQIAEDQENVSCGFWPGNANAAGVTFGEPAFYSYANPAPAGIENASVRPAGAHFENRIGEFILLYEDARRASSPEQAILEFFQSTYEAGARLAGWDRTALEAAPA